MWDLCNAPYLNPTLLRRTTAVMRNRRDVSDAGDLQTAVVQCTYCGLAAGARAANTHFHVLHAMFLRGITCLLGGNLRGERRALARAAETAAPRGRPVQCVALTICDRDDRVVEGRMDVRDCIEHVLAGLLRLLGGVGSVLLSAVGACFLFGHLFRPPYALPGGAL